MESDCCICGDDCSLVISQNDTMPLSEVFGKRLEDLGPSEPDWLDQLLKDDLPTNEVFQPKFPTEIGNLPNLSISESESESSQKLAPSFSGARTPQIHYRLEELRFLNSPSPFPERLISDIHRQSTPRTLAQSLGADSTDSDLSWTSSLATPPRPGNEGRMLVRQSSIRVSEMSSPEMVECAKFMGPARALFSPGLHPDSDASLLVRTLPPDPIASQSLTSSCDVITSSVGTSGGDVITSSQSTASQSSQSQSLLPQEASFLRDVNKSDPLFDESKTNDITIVSNDVTTSESDVTIENWKSEASVHERSSSECDDFPCTEPFELAEPMSQVFVPNKYRTRLRPTAEGSVEILNSEQKMAVSSVENSSESENSCGLLSQKSTQALRESLVKSGFGEVAKIGDRRSSAVMVWLEGGSEARVPKTACQKKEKRTFEREISCDGAESGTKDYQYDLKNELANASGSDIRSVSNETNCDRITAEIPTKLVGIQKVTASCDNEESKPMKSDTEKRDDVTKFATYKSLANKKDVIENQNFVIEMTEAENLVQEKDDEVKETRVEHNILDLLFSSPPPEARRAAPKRKRKRGPLPADDIVAMMTDLKTDSIVAMDADLLFAKESVDRETAVSVTTGGSVAKKENEPPATVAVGEDLVAMVTPDSKRANDDDDPFSPLSQNTIDSIKTPDLKNEKFEPIATDAEQRTPVAKVTIAKSTIVTPKITKADPGMFSPISPRTLAVVATTPVSDGSLDSTFTQISPETLAAMVRETDKTCQMATTEKYAVSPALNQSDTSSPASRDTSGYVSASLSSITTPSMPSTLPSPIVPVNSSESLVFKPLSDTEKPALKSDSDFALKRRQKRFAYPTAKNVVGQPKRLFTLPVIEEGSTKVESIENCDKPRTIGTDGKEHLLKVEKPSKLAKFDEEVKKLCISTSVEVQVEEPTPEASSIENYSKTERVDFSAPNRGFSCASGKKIEVSSEAMGKARSMLVEFVDDLGATSGCIGKVAMLEKNDGSIKPETCAGNGIVKSETECQGFLTASKKTVAVSEEALAEADNLLTDLEVKLPKRIDESRELFSNASNSIEQTRLEEFSNPTPGTSSDLSRNLEKQSEIDIRLQTMQKQNGGCFTSASGGAISVSSSAFEKAGKLFADVDDSSEVQPRISIEGSSKTEPLVMKNAIEDEGNGNGIGKDDLPAGFLAAISEKGKGPMKKKAFKAPRPVLKRKNSDPKRDVANGVNVVSKLARIANQEDGGNPLNVHKNLTVTEKSNENVVSHCNKELVEKFNLANSSESRGFKTAGGKSLVVSEESLKTANSILESVETDSELIKGMEELNSGLPVKTKTDVKSKIVSECSPTTNAQDLDEKVPLSVGFSSAAGRELKPSESALKKMAHFVNGTESLNLDENANISQKASVFLKDEKSAKEDGANSCSTSCKRSDAKPNSEVESPSQVDHHDWDISNTQMIRACSEFETEAVDQTETKEVEVGAIKMQTISKLCENSESQKWMTNTQLLGCSEEEMEIEGNFEESESKNDPKVNANTDGNLVEKVDNEEHSAYFEGLDDSGFTQEILEKTDAEPAKAGNESKRPEPETKIQKVDQEKLEVNEAKIEEENEADMEVSFVVEEDVNLEKSQETFEGFRTASGYQVTVSQDSMEKALEKFGDMDNFEMNGEKDLMPAGTSNVDDAENVPKFEGFSSASGKKIATSEKALKQVRSIFADDDDELSRLVKKEEMSGLEKDSIVFKGFATADGKKIEVSEEALAKVRGKMSILNDEVHLDEKREFDQEKEMSENGDVGNMSGFAGFKTAAGKKVETSEEALANVCGLFQEKDDCDTFQSVQPIGFAGFSTGRGEKVEVSEESLAKVRGGVLQDFVEPSDLGPGPSKTGFKGFSIAGGQTIEVSAEALAKVLSNRLLDISESESDVIPVRRGRSVSGESLAKIRANLPAGSESLATRKFDGFSTGNGKKVDVSQKALNEVRGFFTENEPVEDAGNEQKSTAFQGFSTGRGKKVKISDEALAKVRGFAETENVSIEQVIPPSGFDGFATAAGKKVQVSEGAHAKVKGLEIDETGTNAGFRGFATAGGKKVEVSEKTLAEVKGITESAVSEENKEISKRVRNSEADGRRKVNFATDLENSEENFTTPFKKARGDSVTPTRGKGPQDQKIGPGGDANSEEIADDSETKCGLFAPEMVARLGQARFCQEQVIRKKKRQKIKPVPGSLSKLKKEKKKKVSLAELAEMEEEELTNVDEYFEENDVNVTAENAEEYEFKACDHWASEELCESVQVELEDGSVLVFTDRWTAGKHEFARSLLAMPGVDPSLISEVWLFNHYRWLVWKLASYERRFPNVAARSLTPKNVMLQLKYRYDREIDNSERSCLKKIFEHDDTPNKRMVLCVAQLFTSETTPESGKQEKSGRTPGKFEAQSSQVSCLLTDGWYSIRAQLDPAMEGLVVKGRVKVGQKWCISGAELTSADAYPPLEAPDHVQLKIHSNSCRPCAWNAKLGYQRDPRSLRVSLSSLYVDGGPVGCVDVMVLRRYPTQYKERLPDGSLVFRSGREEERCGRTFARDREKRMEELYAQLQEKYEAQEVKRVPGKKRKKLTRRQIEGLDCGHEVYEAVMDATDPTSVEAYLSTYQRRLLEEYRTNLVQERNQQLQNELQQLVQDDQQNMVTSRNVTPFVRLKVVGYSAADREKGTTMYVNVQKPTEETLKTLEEGKRVRIFSLTPLRARGRPTAEFHLHTSRSTRYQPLEPTSDHAFLPRDLLTGSDVVTARGDVITPAYGELDTMGVVVKIVPDCATYANRRQTGFQTVYLADQDQLFLAVKFWGGLQSFHVSDVINVGDVITVANLEWRQNGSRARAGHVTSVFVTEVTSFSTKMPENKEYREPYQKLMKMNIPAFRDECRTALEDYLTTPNTPLSTPANARGKTPVRPHDAMPRHCDVTPRQGDVTPLNQSETLKKRQLLQQAKARKLDYFEAQAPALNELTIRSSQSARKNFKSPFASMTMYQDSPPMDLDSSQESISSPPKSVTSQNTNLETSKTFSRNVKETMRNNSKTAETPVSSSVKLVASCAKTVTSSASIMTSSTPASRPRARASGLSASRRRTVQVPTKTEPKPAKTPSKTVQKSTKSNSSKKKKKQFQTPSKKDSGPRKLTYHEDEGENSDSSVDLDVLSGQNAVKIAKNSSPKKNDASKTEAKSQKRKRALDLVELEECSNKRQRRSSRISRN